MTQPRDRTGLTIHPDDIIRVSVNNGPETAGKIVSTTPSNPALQGCALVSFSNGMAQWVDGKHLEVFTMQS